VTDEARAREQRLEHEPGFPRAPLPIARPRAEHFPTTHLTTLLADLRAPTPAGATPAHARLAHTIMARYAGPLEIYAKGSTLREIAEPAELVHGYFAHALADPGYFERYLASGLRLRRWLMNGLLLHARGVARDRARSVRREGAALEAATATPAAEPGPSDAYDRAWALALLSEACASVEASLLAEGRDRAWTVFRRHAIDGRSYLDLEREIGLGRQQMADLVRGVTRRLRARIVELLREERGTDAAVGHASHEERDLAEELREVARLLG
jgi:hypothetical protein